MIKQLLETLPPKAFAEMQSLAREEIKYFSSNTMVSLADITYGAHVYLRSPPLVVLMVETLGELLVHAIAEAETDAEVVDVTDELLEFLQSMLPRIINERASELNAARTVDGVYTRLKAGVVDSPQALVDAMSCVGAEAVKH